MSESKEEIMEATAAALKKHGYRELSIQNIADEFDKSKSLLYHHYEGKDDLLLDYMDIMLERYEEECKIGNEEMSSKEKFEKAAFMAFEDNEAAKTFIELRANSLRDERYLKRFEKFSKKYREQIEELIEENNFKDEETTQIAEFIQGVNNEAVFRRAEGRGVENLKKELKEYLEYKLYK